MSRLFNLSVSFSIYQSVKVPELNSLVFAVLLAGALSGCQLLGKISLQPPGPKPGPLPSTQAGAPGALSGSWKVAFQVGDKVMKSDVRLEQEGNQFSGEGTDDPTGRPFLIANGQINNNQVWFHKQYEGLDPNAAPPIEYSGVLEAAGQGAGQAPYMHGTYQTVLQGKPLQGDWQAQMVEAAAPAVAAPAASGPAGAAGGGTGVSTAPHLSGKWRAAYEYNFKTIKSELYLEQNGGAIKGHGVDLNTKEKFVIAKGWYHFPRLTLIRQYVKGKGAAATRTVTFKAEVTLVNEADYQGPYLHGKTQGGGEWEAQLIR